MRLLLACLLAKLDRPNVDIRKPYTQIGDADAYSGRSYDEQSVTPFINRHRLPCNSTTAFLTPALRNRNTALVRGLDLVGRPPRLYTAVLDLLDDVQQGRAAAADLLAETIRVLLVLRDEQDQRIAALVAALETTAGALPLSAEAIVNLLQQHMSLKGSSRLPVLMVAAAYQSAAAQLGERVNAIQPHTAADSQTGTLGDLEITLAAAQDVVTVYEMKTRPVARADIERALQKTLTAASALASYVFITTEPIAAEVQAYALSLYGDTGIEFVILDCVAFVRHFLHLFHPLRSAFLERYQALLLAEPESAVSQPVKEAFLAMRQAAESTDA